ncbi:SseB family protein [Humibacter ginsenosidimutans]|uniref:SseB family protein n=1 Tax=Humibacter ginsenosidimutans TaxID=2599293 RepID=UPI00349EF59E
MPDTDGSRHLFGSTDKADSAGLPWAGRTFDSAPASTDDGSADPALLAALIAFDAGHGSQRAVLEAFRAARLLVPLLAHAGELGEAADGHLVDKTQELSIATVGAPDGRAVLPAFTSVATLSAWNSKARPVPAAGPRVALAAASEETQLIVIDPTSLTEFVLRRPMVTALATGADWCEPWSDAEVVGAFRASIAEETAVAGIELRAGDPHARLAAAEVEVTLSIVVGLDAGALRDLVQRVSARWGSRPSSPSASTR